MLFVSQVLFHTPFLEACKQIIAAALAEACSSIQGPLAAALQAAAEHDPEPAGHLQPGSWPSVHNTAADKAAAAAAADALERAGSLWTAGSLGQQGGPSSSWGLSVSRALSMHPSGPLKDQEQGPAGRQQRHVPSVGVDVVTPKVLDHRVVSCNCVFRHMG